MPDTKLWIFFGIALSTMVLLTGCHSVTQSGETLIETQIETEPPNIGAAQDLTATDTPLVEVHEESTATEIPHVELAEKQARSLTGTISLWHSLEEDEREGLRFIIAAFQEQNPTVDFIVRYFPLYDLRDQYETAAANGEAPILLIGTADWGPALWKADLTVDLSSLVDLTLLQGINLAALDSVRYNGVLIGLPLGLKGVVLYRNNSIIPEAPTTVENLIAAARATTSDDIVGADLERGFFFSAGHLYAGGGQLMDENGDAQFNSREGVEWLNLLKSFSDAGQTEYNTDDDLDRFKAGTAGMIIDVTWNLEEIAAAVGKENLSIDPWPAGMSGFVQSDNIYMSVNAEGAIREAAWAFMEYLLTPESQAILCENSSSFIPAALGIDIGDRLRQEVAAAFEGGISFPVIPEMGAYWGPMDTALKSVFFEGADPATALQQAFDSVVVEITKIRSRN